MAKADVTVLLVRSGPSSWDEAGRLEGRSDLPLAGDAVETVRNAIARRTRDGGLLPDLVLYWGEHGCKQTADVVSGQAACKSKVSEGVAPMSLGLWEGTLEAELLERNPKPFKRWLSDPSSVTAPEGESTGEFEERIIGVLGRVAEKHAGRVVAMVMRPMEFAIVSALLLGDEGKDTEDDEGGDLDTLREFRINAASVKALRGKVQVGT